MLAASAVALVSVMRLARTSRSLQSKLEPLSARLTSSADELNRKNALLTAGQEQAKRSIERLRGSILQLQVLVAALEEIRIALKVIRIVRTLR